MKISGSLRQFMREHAFALKWANVLAILLLLGPVTVSIISLMALAHDSKVIPSIMSAVADSPTLLFSLVWFTVSLLILHVAVAWLWVWLWAPVSRVIGGARVRRETIAGCLLTLSVLCLALSGAEWFPHSRLGQGLNGVLEQPSGRLFWRVSQAILVVFVIAGFILQMGRILKSPRAIAGLLLLTLVAAVPMYRALIPVTHAGTRSKPDIIIIGVDSLRLDHMERNGSDRSYVPTIEAILAKAAVFDDALTPLARTFPAFLSLLTGNDPITHGARYNLISNDQLQSKETLATILRNNGYQTAYAIDESRFSNLDETFGFDNVISPPMGAADFLLGAISDLPLHNIISNTFIGEYLFPYSYSNRALHFTYSPESFSRELSALIRHEIDPNKPVFLVTHFELPHWPYVWRDYLAPTEQTKARDSVPSEYKAALLRADQQVASLIGSLERSGRLTNAILVLMSDHGEAFEMTAEPAHDGTGGLTVAAGHGTHVFSAHQYQVLLAFRRYGISTVAPGSRRGTATLNDVTPTLLEWLGITDGRVNLGQDGISLLPYILEPDIPVPDRPIYLETGFSIPSIEAGNPDAGLALREGGEFYRIGRNGRLTLDPVWMPKLMSEKQRAIVIGNHILASLPVGGTSASMYFKDRIHGTVRQVTREQFETNPKLLEMAYAFCSRYSQDQGFDVSLCDVIIRQQGLSLQRFVPAPP